MTTINLCGRPSCGSCPKLVITRGKKKRFKITDDYGGEVNLTDDEVRNLALAIFAEMKR